MACLHFEHIITIVSAYIYMAIDHKELIQIIMWIIFGYKLFITQPPNELQIKELEYACHSCHDDLEFYKNRIALIETKYTNLFNKITANEKKMKKNQQKSYKKIGNLCKIMDGIEFDISNIQFDLNTFDSKFKKINSDIIELDEIAENTDGILSTINKNIDKLDMYINTLMRDSDHNCERINTHIYMTNNQIDFIKNEVVGILQLYNEIKSNYELTYINSECSSPFRKLELTELDETAGNYDIDSNL